MILTVTFKYPQLPLLWMDYMVILGVLTLNRLSKDHTISYSLDRTSKFSTSSFDNAWAHPKCSSPNKLWTQCVRGNQPHHWKNYTCDELVSIPNFIGMWYTIYGINHLYQYRRKTDLVEFSLAIPSKNWILLCVIHDWFLIFINAK